MSQTVSLSMPDELGLYRYASMLGNGTTRNKAGVILLDETLREKEISGIEFRNTILGRQPFVKQTGMAVWEFIMVARDFEMDAEQTAAHLQYSVDMVQAALNYYTSYSNEIDQALAENDIGEERLKQMFLNLKVFSFPFQEEKQSA